MTEPDEALLWARAQAKARLSALNNPHRDIIAEVDAGRYDDELSDEAHAYRAGQAASATKIDAARLEGIQLGLEAAAKAADKGGFTSDWSRAISETVSVIRALDPETIAREGVLDKLASEAQEQGMGYDGKAIYGVKVVRPRMFAPLTAKEADQ